MAEKSIDQKVLEDAISNALKTLLLTSSETGATNPHEEFYDKVQTESDEYDKYFLHKYGKDLDTTLLFAALFSAISASFILDIKTRLEPDYSKLNYAALVFIANSTQIRGSDQLPSFGVSPDKAIWTGPEPIIVHVQAVLFSSLAISLLAAFIAMLSKQWLGRYSESHGSLTDRGRDRQRKINGVNTWHFDLIMECLPLLLQVALFLFNYALSIYLFTINKAVAAVTIGLASFGLLFYFLIVFAATLSYNCPFQTPLSLFLRFLFRLKDKDKNHLVQAWSRLKRIFSCGLCRIRRPHARQGDHDDHFALAVVGPLYRLLPLAPGETCWVEYMLDSDRITWLFEKSRDTKIIMAIVRVIPEIIWHSGIETTPLGRLYDIVLECFDYSSKPPVVIPTLREKAYLSAKALVHLAIQRMDIDREVFRSISSRHRDSIIVSEHCGADSDLESTLGMIDRVFKDDTFDPMRWEQFSFTAPHHSWMGYTLRCCAWHALRDNKSLPRDAEQFILHSLQLVPPPPDPVVVECLHIITLVLRIPLQDDDQQVINERISSQIDSIYEELERVWGDNTAKVHALEAMRLITPLSRTGVATKNYHLFQTVMDSSIFPTRSDEEWEASRLALHSALKGDEPLSPVNDPQGILTFLNYHFNLALKGDNQDEPIQNALRALAYTSNPADIDAFDLAQESFVRGICFAFKTDRPHKLREAALSLLPLIGNKWFDATPKIIPADEMKSFCVDWATAVDGIKHTSDDQKVAILTALFHMMDSPLWRPHIPEGKWKMLEHYPLVPDSCRPLKRCLENQELVTAISQVTDPDAIALWPTILWLNYKKLAAPVQEALKNTTKAAPSHIDDYLTAVESERKVAEKEREKYARQSNEPVAVALDREIGNHYEAEVTLQAIGHQADADFLVKIQEEL